MLELNRSTPAPFNALTDGTIYLGVANGFRGTAAGPSATSTTSSRRWSYKASRGIGTLRGRAVPPALRRRALLPDLPPLQRAVHRAGRHVRQLDLPVVRLGRREPGFEYDLDATRSRAWPRALLIGVRDAMDSMFFTDARARPRWPTTSIVDGIVFHPIKSCRTVSTGLADSRRALMERRDIPSLFIESDMMDRRVVSEAQIKNRIDAFFEGLASRRRPARPRVAQRLDLRRGE